MREKVIIYICALVIFIFSLSRWVYADEPSDLKAEMIIMQRQMQAMQKK